MALSATQARNQAVAISETYTRQSLDGVGALKGAPCEIKSIVKENGRNTVTFLWKDKNNVSHESLMIVLDGTPIYVWTSGNTYQYGDLVIYASAFYRCIVTNSDVEFDGTKWNEIGSPDGNYDIVENSDLLPAIFTAADRKLYYSIEDGFFWLWNGEEWEAQVDNEPVEGEMGYVSSGALFNVKEALESSQAILTSVVNTNIAKIQALESGQNVLTSVANIHTGQISALEAGQNVLTSVVNSKIPLTQKGAADGVAELDSNGKVPSSQLPSGIPSGGTAGQVLTKQSAEDGDADWEDIPDNLNTTDAEIDTIADNIFNLDASARIYGVLWDGGESSVFTRTDDAADFPNPVPYVAGATVYGSPFDNISPWKDMKVVDDPQCGKLVQIPKYYYKWTKTGDAMLLQVSMKPFTGSLVSPAHADRGDGKGERDVVYIGRYHCGVNDYRSVSGVLPKGNLTRAEFRSAIHGLGSDVWQNDYALFWTVRMLYLVEFADWDSQKVIGYGCGDGSATGNMGYTDSMPYHTGTTQASRTTYGLGTQYRNIEGWWDNVYDWCDGIYFSSTNVYCIKNPANFSDTSGGTQIGTRPSASGWIKEWSVPTAQGFEYAIYPSDKDGAEGSYVCDYCSYYASGVVLLVGGDYSQYQHLGAFYLYGNYAASSKYANVGSRLQKLP